MLKNYLKIALRNLRKNKIYSFITIFGLSIGLACSMLMLIYIYYEFSYDRFNKKADRIYRLGREISSAEGEMREPLSSAKAAVILKQDYPEVADAVRFKGIDKAIVRYKDKQFFERDLYYVDPAVFKIFTLPMIEGNPETALANPYSIVVTRETAIKYFGSEKVLGKLLIINKNDFLITGVIENLPETTHRKINILCSFQTLINQNQPDLEDWLSFNYSTYILLREGADIESVESKLPSMIKQHIGDGTKKLHGTLSFYLLPLKKVHLYNHLDGFKPGLFSKIISFSFIALLIILIACINFINLSTAKAPIRGKEIGLRKVVGANRFMLIKQHLIESLIICLLAFAFALLLVELFLPLFRNNMESSLNLTKTQLLEIYAVFLLLTVTTGLLSGIYPAFYLTRFQPVQVLKNNLHTGKKKSVMRCILVSMQFFFSIILICETMLINHQLNYMKRKHPGFHKKDVVVLPIDDNELRKSLKTFKIELLENNEVLSVTASSSLPGLIVPRSVKLPEGYSKDEMQLMDEINIDSDFIPALNIEMEKGRNFFEGDKADQENSIIINELAVKKFAWDKPGENPIGKSIKTSVGQDQFEIRTVIGVVKDFHLSSMNRLIEPLYISNNAENLNYILVRLSPGSTHKLLKYIQMKWEQLYPEYPFTYTFLETEYDLYFRILERIIDNVMFFSILAVLLACMGTYALTAFVSERRTKEIGIRKVLGDSTLGIIFRLNTEIFKYILFAVLFFIPAIFFVKDYFRSFFPYLSEIDNFIYIKSMLIVFAVALMSTSYQSIKSALANPVESLRYE
ncbi:MAG: ABC transporter permease [Ignavibacteria bacterium]